VLSLPFVFHLPVHNLAFTCYMVGITLNFSSELLYIFFFTKAAVKLSMLLIIFWPLFFSHPCGPQRVKRIPSDAGMLC
jgi:hypothetical protein